MSWSSPSPSNQILDQVPPVSQPPQDGVCDAVISSHYINPLRAKLLRENINMYLHFMSFLHTNKTQVAEIPPGVRRRPAYST